MDEVSLKALRTLAAGGRLVPPEAARGIAAGLVTLDELRRGQQALAGGLLELLAGPEVVGQNGTSRRKRDQVDENRTSPGKVVRLPGRPGGRLEAVLDEVHVPAPGLVQVLERAPAPPTVHVDTVADKPLRAEARGWADARAGRPVKACPFRPGSVLDQDYRQGHRRALEAHKDDGYTPGPVPGPLPVGLEPKDRPVPVRVARAAVGRRRAYEAGLAARAARAPLGNCPHLNPQGGYRRAWLAGRAGEPYPGGPDA